VYRFEALLGIAWALLGFIEVLMRIMDVIKVLLSLFFQVIILNLNY